MNRARSGHAIPRTANRTSACLLITTAVLLFPGIALADDGLDDWTYAEPSSNFGFRVERFAANPIIHSQMHGLVGEAGENINGPSLIRVPDWIDNPLGKYYLYFAHHHGSYIRLAYADSLEGPWKIHSGGVLPLEETPTYEGRSGDHVASPDVHVDHDEQRIRMYYHALSRPDEPWHQGTYVAISDDGLGFEPLPQYLGLFYFRVFEHCEYAFGDRHLVRRWSGCHAWGHEPRTTTTDGRAVATGV